MKRLMLYAKQLNQRRMSAFYLLPQHNEDTTDTLSGQLRLKSVAAHEDRPRSVREMFADVEYDAEDDAS